MKIKNKGKVHPSPSSSSSSSQSPASITSDGDYFSVLKLLPAAIFTLISVLSLEDRDVLAYMITRSLKTTTTTTTTTTTATTRKSSSTVVQDSKNSGKRRLNRKQTAVSHKPPVFDCDCFDCYTSYWFRWDSSPNRELIHQAIEAFEDHLTKNEAGKSKRNGKKKEKSARRVMDRPGPPSPVLEVPSSPPEVEEEEEDSILDPIVASEDSKSVDNNESPSSSFDIVSKSDEGEGERDGAEIAVDSPEETLQVVRLGVNGGPKGLARKVLPDVLGLLSSRLWSLWNPNV